MHQSLARIQRVDANVLMCMDYLLAGIDYGEFLYMMLDFKVSKSRGLILVGGQLLGRRWLRPVLKETISIKITFPN